MMNNYIDYYNYMNDLNQSKLNKNGLNQMNLNNNVKSNKDYSTDPYEAFIRGNLFSNLYTPYKNYKPAELNPTNEKDYYLLLVQIYGFAAHELTLYLDVNPNDDDAIKLRSEYVKLYNQALMQYESKYGAISLKSMTLNSSPWAWDSKKWPWEGDK